MLQALDSWTLMWNDFREEATEGVGVVSVGGLVAEV